MHVPPFWSLLVPSGQVVLFKITLFKFAPFAPCRLAPRRSAFVKLAPCRLAPTRVAPLRSAPPPAVPAPASSGGSSRSAPRLCLYRCLCRAARTDLFAASELQDQCLIERRDRREVKTVQAPT
jgi:hypothetical protein